VGADPSRRVAAVAVAADSVREARAEADRRAYLSHPEQPDDFWEHAQAWSDETGRASVAAAVPQSDREAVARMLGREPAGHFDVVARRPSGSPAVILNAPILEDGRPMPTRYWLVDEHLRRLVGRLESDGGVRAAEAAVDADELAEAHDRYAAERDGAIPEDHQGPRPSGGVGGTRRGVKCLHAHYAWHLAGGDDPVGRWVAERLGPAAAAPVRRVQ